MTTTAIPDNPGELTTYIETHYHARHREVLPHLASLAAKVEQDADFVLERGDQLGFGENHET